ncbi:MAG: amino acid ABC transporter permease [Rhodobacteraceae bacterium]|jgi:polar amino acid transport system permease protein|nr:amino acid ABC transporter permease [Paracoccaceae bacterium]
MGTWDFRIVMLDWPVLLQATGHTLLLCAVALLIGVPLGLVLTILRRFGPAPVRSLTIAVVEFLRVSAPVVLIIWFYFAFPILTGINVDAFTAGALAVGVQASAFFSEICRAGINAVDPGQVEAAKAIGMRTGTLMGHIVLPQALRHMIPVMVSLVAEIVKATSLVAVIGYGELSYAASRIAADTYRPVESYTVVAVIYFVLIFSISRFAALLERRLARRA